jgi:hypothetical protein
LNYRQLALVGVAALALGGTTAVAQVAQQSPPAQVTPPPPPPPNGSVATPSSPAGAAPAITIPPEPSQAPNAAPAGGRRGRRGGAPAGGANPAASPSETPEPPQFQTMDGVWEVQLQPMDRSGKTIYSHLYVKQASDGSLTGYWMRADRSRMNFTGTFDGRLFKIALTPAGPDPAPAPEKAKSTGKGASTATPAPWELPGVSYTMSGYAENFGDMVGMLSSSDPKDKGTPFTASHRKKERSAIGVQ